MNDTLTTVPAKVDTTGFVPFIKSTDGHIVGLHLLAAAVLAVLLSRSRP